MKEEKGEKRRREGGEKGGEKVKKVFFWKVEWV